MTKIFAIGDIHGCFNKLVSLMDKVNIDFNQDTIVFMGDYIDRGPDSFEVVEYLMHLKKKYSNIVLLKGNHEEMLLNYLSGSDRYLYLSNGGQQTIESYMDRPYNIKAGPIPSDHLDFIKSLDLFYETEDYIFVHAGLKKRCHLKSKWQTIFSGYAKTLSKLIMILGNVLFLGIHRSQNPLWNLTK